MSLSSPAPRPLKVERREIRTVDTNQVITGIDFYGDLTQGGAYGLAEYNMLDMLKLYNWLRWLYVRNQTVTLTYVGSSGNLGNMRDTRYRAGDATNHPNSFRSAAQTPDIENVNTNWTKIQVNYDTSVPLPAVVNYNANSRPLTMGSYSPNRKSMREFSFNTLGELVAEALAEIGGNKSNSVIADMTTGRMGGYAIIRQDATLPATHDDGGTLTDMGRVFEDTIANASAYTSGGIPETKDQPLAVNTANQWNLYSMDVPTSAPPPPPNMVYVNADGSIQEWGLAGMQQFFEPFIQHVAANGYNSSGSGKLIWYISGNIGGVNLGSGSSIYPLDAGFGEVENERLNGSSAAGYTTGPAQPPTGDNYRTQEFPNGVPVVQNTYSLRAYTNP